MNFNSFVELLNFVFNYLFENYLVDIDGAIDQERIRHINWANADHRRRFIQNAISSSSGGTALQIQRTIRGVDRTAICLRIPVEANANAAVKVNF